MNCCFWRRSRTDSAPVSPRGECRNSSAMSAFRSDWRRPTRWKRRARRSSRHYHGFNIHALQLPCRDNDARTTTQGRRGRVGVGQRDEWQCKRNVDRGRTIACENAVPAASSADDLRNKPWPGIDCGNPTAGSGSIYIRTNDEACMTVVIYSSAVPVCPKRHCLERPESNRCMRNPSPPAARANRLSMHSTTL